LKTLKFGECKHNESKKEISLSLFTFSLYEKVSGNLNRSSFILEQRRVFSWRLFFIFIQRICVNSSVWIPLTRLSKSLFLDNARSPKNQRVAF